MTHNLTLYFEAACEAEPAITFMEDTVGVDMEKLTEVYNRFGCWTDEHTEAFINFMPSLISFRDSGSNIVWMIADFFEFTSRMAPGSNTVQ